MPARSATGPRLARVVAAALVALATASLPSPTAATLNTFLSARALAPRETDLGVSGGAGDTDPDYVVLNVMARRGLIRGVDAGVRAGALSVDRPGADAPGALIGADARVQVLRESIEIPFDFAVDVAWTSAFPGGRSYSDLSFSALFSKTVEPGLVAALVPYLGAELTFTSGSGRPTQTDTAAYGMGGVDVWIGRRVAFTPEIKVGEHLAYGAALRYRF